MSPEADDRSGFRKETGEESPDTLRQSTVENTRDASGKPGADGKCHRKQTASRVKAGGKGEKAG